VCQLTQWQKPRGKETNNLRAIYRWHLNLLMVNLLNISVMKILITTTPH
jgi:hypothetical protein